MKKCTKCNISKELGCFNKEPGGANGLKSYCKVCQARANKAYREIHKDYFKEKGAEFYKNNKAKRKTNAKEWILNNYDKYLAKAAKCRATKLHATPSWLTKEQLYEIEEFYTLAQELAWLNQDGKAFHVDHIVPLQGKEVSGLHVPWNLQLLPAVENLKKSNKI